MHKALVIVPTSSPASLQRKKEIVLSKTFAPKNAGRNNQRPNQNAPKPGYWNHPVVDRAPGTQQIRLRGNHVTQRDKFCLVVGNEVLALMWRLYKLDEMGGAYAWDFGTRRDALRYMRTLIYAEATELDCTLLAEEQLQAIRTIFMVLCHYEADGLLYQSWKDSMGNIVGQDLILPGMTEEWYTEQIDDVVEAVNKSHIRDSWKYLARWRRATFVATEVTEEVKEAELVNA